MKTILILLFIILSGCSHSIIAKDCKPVQDDQKYVCRSILPWQ